MTRRAYWGLVPLLLIIGIFVYLIVKNHVEVVHFEREFNAPGKVLSSLEDKQDPSSAVSEKGDSLPPPLGETEGTGYWEGNTWHQKNAPPQAKKKPFWDFWSEDPDKLRRMFINGEAPPNMEHDAFGRWIIAEYPYSEAALEARLHFYRLREADLKAFLKYHPQSPRLHLAIARTTASSEESVAFAKKALRLLPNSSEDYSHIEFHWRPDVLANMTLGREYQRLGDYKSALVHLKTTQRLLKPEVVEDSGVWTVHPETGEEWKMYDNRETTVYYLMVEEIAAIESGKPQFGPGLAPQLKKSSDFPKFSSDAVPSSGVVIDSEVPSVRFFDFPHSVSDDIFRDLPASGVSPDAQRALMAQEHAETVGRREREVREFESFLLWMGEIESAASPSDLDNFLMREMAVQLQGGYSEFTPDRLIRAFEMMHRHGESEGKRALEKLDAELDREMSRQASKNKKPRAPCPE